MDVSNTIKDTVAQAKFVLKYPAAFFEGIKTYIGTVVDLTALSELLKEAKQFYKENVEESPNIFVKQRETIISFAATVNEAAIFVLSLMKQTPDLTNTLKDLVIAKNVFNILDLLELRTIFTDIKKYPAMVRAAEKADQIAKVALVGVGILAKIAKAPITVIESMTPIVDYLHEIGKLPILDRFGDLSFAEIVKFDKWAPSLGAVALVLSTAFTALKIWDLYDTCKLTDRLKEKCCLEVARNLENELKDEFSGNQPLLTKLNLILSLDKDKKELKGLHKHEQAFQKELNKDTPDAQELLKLLDEMKPSNDKSLAIVEQLKATVSLSELNECLSRPEFKKSVLDSTSELLQSTFAEMNEAIKQRKAIDLKALKQEIKQAAAEISPEVLAQVNRSAKLAYIQILADYKSAKLSKLYQVKGDDLKGAAKNTADLATSLLANKKENLADEKLTIAYRSLKGRISHKKFSTKMSIVLNSFSMAAASISLAIALGSLPTPVAPVGIALAVVTSAVGLLLALINTFKTMKFQDRIGITEVNLKKTMEERLSKLEDDHPFIKSLSPNQKKLYDTIKTQVAAGNFHSVIYSQFDVPKVNRTSTDDQRATRLASIQMNHMIQSMNDWVEKREAVQDRLLIKHWNAELNKLSPIYLPKEHFGLYENMIKAMENKDFETLGTLKQISIKDGWTEQEKVSIKGINRVLESMHRHSEERYQISIGNRKEKIEKITKQHIKNPASKTKKSETNLQKLQKQLDEQEIVLAKIRSS